jgi:O-antigen/teichoic acid export membrane protein
MFITVLIGLYASRVQLNQLGVIDFGIYSVTGGLITLINFFNIIMVTTTHRYIAIEIGKGNQQSISVIFSSSFLFHLILAIVTCILAETIGVYYIYNLLNVPFGKINDVLYIFHFSLIASFISILSTPFQAILTAYENFSLLASINIFTSFITLCISFSLNLINENKLIIFSLMMSISNIIGSTMFFFYVKIKYAWIKLSLITRNKLYKEIAAFSLWVAIGAASTLAKIQGCTLLINYFFGVVYNTSFGLANQVNNQLNQFSQNVNRAFAPQITKNFAVDNRVESFNLVCYSSKYSFFMFYLLCIPFLVEGDYILQLWLGVGQYPPVTVSFIKLLIINSLFDSLNSGIHPFIQATGKIKYFQLSMSTISLLLLPVGYILFKIGFFVHSLLIVYIIMSFSFIFIRLFLLKKIVVFDISVFVLRVYIRSVYVILFTIPVFVILYFFSASIFRFCLTIFLTIIFLTLGIYTVGIDKSEKLMLHRFIQRRRDILCKRHLLRF